MHILKFSRALGVLSSSFLFLSSPAFGSDCSKESFVEFRHHYFASLDYFNPKISEAIPAQLSFYSSLAEETSKEISALGADCQKISALRLAYIAMYIKNADEGILAGQLKGEDFPGTAASREQTRLNYLNQALLYLPDDQLIQGWKSGAVVTLEVASSGSASEAGVQELFKVAHDGPYFNLWAAIINSNNIPLSTTKLFDLVTLTDQFLSIADPPRPPRPTDVFFPNSEVMKYAPFNQHAVTTLMGDTFAKGGEALLTDGDSSNDGNGTGLIYKAIGFYKSQVNLPAVQALPLKQSLEKRIENAQKFLSEKEILSPFLRSAEGLRINSCTACHSSGGL